MAIPIRPSPSLITQTNYKVRKLKIYNLIRIIVRSENHRCPEHAAQNNEWIGYLLAINFSIFWNVVGTIARLNNSIMHANPTISGIFRISKKGNFRWPLYANTKKGRGQFMLSYFFLWWKKVFAKGGMATPLPTSIPSIICIFSCLTII